MEKVLTGVVVGIFVGALTVEILNRTKPGLTRKIERKAKDTVGALVAAFKEGFEDESDKTEAVQPEQSPA
jgi:hypothetical protein